MSVLRDAIQLGYGTDHFMITGENFPSSWGDETNPYTHYDDDELCIPKKPGSLDTKKGWIKRKHIVHNDVDSVGMIEGIEYYHIDQTTHFNNVMGNTIELVEKSLNKLSIYIENHAIATEADLDSEYSDITDEIMYQLYFSYQLLKENISFHEHYIDPNVKPIGPVDDDIPF